ncbi:MAG TPA: hypothetical protein VFA33_21535 [Bryobacteraceae bacterium]|nr:hypothetical protein [Bryobacteraceae bacterium]
MPVEVFDGAKGFQGMGSNFFLILDRGDESQSGRLFATNQTVSNPLVIDENVQAFNATNFRNPPDTVLVLGSDGNLWFEFGPFGQPAPKFWTTRQPVDANVISFQAFELGLVYPDTVFVLGSDGNLWLEHGPFGHPAPNFWTRREQVDANVQGFLGVNYDQVFVLGSDGNLWLEQGPFGQPAPNFWTGRTPIDANVQAFATLDGLVETLLVIRTDGTLWLQGHLVTADAAACQVIGRFTRNQGSQQITTLGFLVLAPNFALTYWEVPLPFTGF